MPVVACPIPGCEYATADLDPAIVAALITAHSAVHTSGNTAKVEQVKRPTITAAGTSEEWSYFESRWTDYITATKITGTDRVVQLLECCSEPLRKDLTRAAGGTLTNKTEAQVLAAIKTLAVREENVMVARVNLHNMRQDRDETVRSYGARLQGQAGVCKFVMKCPGCEIEVNYTDSILRDVLTRGIADPDIQLELLGNSKQNMTVEEVFQFVEAKESGKRSASTLLDSHAVDVASSSYRKAKNAQQRDIRDKNIPCSYCGTKGHGKSAPGRQRRLECPAYGHKCELCNRDHHMESVCRSRDNPKRAPAPPHQDSGNAVFNALCNVSDSSQHRSSGRKTIPLDHHVFDNLSDTWRKQRSTPQPFVTVTIKIVKKDYTDLGFDLSASTMSCQAPGLTDTGCQSCLAGIKIISRLGV